MKIEIPGRPVAWARAGCSRGRFFDRQAKEKQSFQWRLKTGFRGSPINRPIALTCTFSFQVPKSWSKVKRAAMLGKPHESRPDLDNLAKFVNDVANGILWQDDAQIARLSLEKVWAEEDKTVIDFEILRAS